MQSTHMHTSSIEEGRKARDCDPPTAVIPPPLHVHPQPLAPTRPMNKTRGARRMGQDSIDGEG